jgi:hypothetical protein
MDPKKEHSEYYDGGTKVERTIYDDPKTNTHVEEIEIEKKDEESDDVRRRSHLS